MHYFILSKLLFSIRIYAVLVCCSDKQLWYRAHHQSYYVSLIKFSPPIPLHIGFESTSLALNFCFKQPADLILSVFALGCLGNLIKHDQVKLYIRAMTSAHSFSALLIVQ